MKCANDLLFLTKTNSFLFLLLFFFSNIGVFLYIDFQIMMNDILTRLDKNLIIK